MAEKKKGKNSMIEKKKSENFKNVWLKINRYHIG